MRFLHLVQRYHPAVGGSEWFMKRLGEELVARGGSVRVLTTTAVEVDALWRPDAKTANPGIEEINGVEVCRLPLRHLPAHGKIMALLAMTPLPDARYRYSMPGPLLPEMAQIERAAGEYDMVVATALPFTSILWAGRKLARSRSVPFIVIPFMHLDIRNRPGYGYRKKHQLELLREADAVIAVTASERNALVRMGIGKDKVKQIDPGIDAASLPEGDGRAFREKHGITGPIVFNVSARTRDKGAHQLLDAMRVLWRRKVEATLVMAGPIRPDFRDRMNGLTPGEKSRIIEMGVVDDATRADVFSAGDVFCMTSRAESFGLAYLEAWHYGAPVVAADVRAVEDVITQGEDGILVPFGNADATATAIRFFLDNPDRARSAVELGRRKLSEKFNWPRTFRQYGAVIRELSGNSPEEGEGVRVGA